MPEITLSRNWVCDGNILKPKIGANSSNTWEKVADKIKPKFGATSRNTYDTNGYSILVVWGQLVLNLW
ncbi:hypothetical protein ACFQ02_07240 [Seminibacterium arietis]|uniref:Uncharacterized protein n=1 Tax=Seminibacterium arietis TaxID=1173502 RepID=A0ABW3IAH3_9PAST